MTSENPQNPIGQQKPTAGANRETDERSAETKPPITPAATSPKTQIPPHQYEVACKTKRDWIDKVTLGFEAFGLAVLIVYTIATIVYACITRNMWKETQEQTRIQREAGINTERAWIGLDGSVIIDALVYQPPRLRAIAHYRIKNFGHGPAFKIQPIGWLETDYKMLGPSLNGWCKSAIAFSTGTVPMGPGLPQPAPRGYMLFPDQEHVEWIGEPNAPFGTDSLPEMKKFWLIGCIAYFDQFKQLHWTRFCQTTSDFGPAPPMNKDVPLHACSLYNDTDDSEHSEDKQPK